MENDWQAALMAPTELLAEQHHRTFTRFWRRSASRRCSSRAASERARATGCGHDDWRRTTPLLVVGTHALVQEATAFARLGLAVIDEQHRFGVEQRAALGAKGDAPDVLLLSATPIPRSLALTVYGDLDVSTLDERPPGRQPINTVLRPESARDRVLGFLRTPNWRRGGRPTSCTR
jgi:ATP-dependent DNA helicase RecG